MDDDNDYDGGVESTLLGAFDSEIQAKKVVESLKQIEPRHNGVLSYAIRRVLFNKSEKPPIPLKKIKKPIVLSHFDDIFQSDDDDIGNGDGQRDSY